MPPGGGVGLERSKDGQCLGGEPGTTSHDAKLYLGRPAVSTASQAGRERTARRCQD